MVKRRGLQRPNDNAVDEGPDDQDLERFGGVTQKCEHCGTECYDDAAVCWQCGLALGSRPSTPPIWIVLVALVLIGIILFGWVLR